MLKSVPLEAIPWSSLATELQAAVGPLMSVPANGETPSATGTSTDTNTYASVVYGVRPGTLEVWWNTSVQEEDMPKAVEIPTLPQVYRARWPEPRETPEIVRASSTFARTVWCGIRLYD